MTTTRCIFFRWHLITFLCFPRKRGSYYLVNFQISATRSWTLRRSSWYPTLSAFIRTLNNFTFVCQCLTFLMQPLTGHAVFMFRYEEWRTTCYSCFLGPESTRTTSAPPLSHVLPSFPSCPDILVALCLLLSPKTNWTSLLYVLFSAVKIRLCHSTFLLIFLGVFLYLFLSLSCFSEMESTDSSWFSGRQLVSASACLLLIVFCCFCPLPLFLSVFTSLMFQFCVLPSMFFFFFSCPLFIIYFSYSVTYYFFLLPCYSALFLNFFVPLPLCSIILFCSVCFLTYVFFVFLLCSLFFYL